jgi:signal transduction histidine kinase
MGFDMAQTRHLFEPFGRIHGEREGAGMGLAIARRIVHRHGGRIWADAVPGRGATFSFTLGELDTA